MGDSRPHNWFVVGQKNLWQHTSVGLVTQRCHLLASSSFSLLRKTLCHKNLYYVQNTLQLASRNSTKYQFIPSWDANLLSTCSPDLFESFRWANFSNSTNRSLVLLWRHSYCVALSARYPTGRRWGYFKARPHIIELQLYWRLYWDLIISYPVTIEMAGKSPEVKLDAAGVIVVEGLRLHQNRWECFHCLWGQAFILAFGHRECLQPSFGLLPSITWNWLS